VLFLRGTKPRGVAIELFRIRNTARRSSAELARFADDEIMGWTTTHFTRQTGVTTELKIRFHRPVYVNDQLEARCRVASREGSMVHLEAEISQAGEVCTSGSGTYLLLDPEKFDRLVHSE
jgi:acyl-CoA thioesterase FadM